MTSSLTTTCGAQGARLSIHPHVHHPRERVDASLATKRCRGRWCGNWTTRKKSPRLSKIYMLIYTLFGCCFLRWSANNPDCSFILKATTVDQEMAGQKTDDEICLFPTWRWLIIFSMTYVDELLVDQFVWWYVVNLLVDGSYLFWLVHDRCKTNSNGSPTGIGSPDPPSIPWPNSAEANP